QSGEGQSGEGQSGESGQGGQSGQGGKQGAAAGEGGQPGQAGGKPGTKGGQGSGSSPTNGPSDGGTADGEGAGSGTDGANTAEDANADYAKQATDLALKKLEDDLQRGDVDPELLKDLGWTESDMRRFADRLRKNLEAPTGAESPQDLAHRKEFEHMLENLSIEKGPSAREARGDRIRNVEGVGTKNPEIPSAYRSAYEAFTRSVAGRRSTADKPK
nr:hypothetical protein [Planctomycetaceae bacterium]